MTPSLTAVVIRDMSNHVCRYRHKLRALDSCRWTCLKHAMTRRDLNLRQRLGLDKADGLDMRDPADLESVARLLHMCPSLAVDSDTVNSHRQIYNV